VVAGRFAGAVPKMNECPGPALLRLVRGNGCDAAPALSTVNSAAGIARLRKVEGFIFYTPKVCGAPSTPDRGNRVFAWRSRPDSSNWPHDGGEIRVAQAGDRRL